MQAKINILNKIRRKIDLIDKKISQLLLQRANEILRIKKIKKREKLPLVDHSREKEILNQFNTFYEKNIFKAIIDASRKLQKIDTPNGNLKKKRKSDKI